MLKIIMASIILPLLSEHQSSSSYFKELISLNKKQNKRFSHRYLAMRLHWPVSYVADLIRGRKHFTVGRALEFSKYARLNVLDTEKMIYLSLSEASNESVKSFFLDKYQKRIAKTSKSFNQTTITDKSLFQDIELEAVLEVLKWARRPLSSTQIKEFLFTFKDLTCEQIDRLIAILKKNRIIEIDEKCLRVLKPQLHLDEFEDGTDGGIAIHKKYAQNFVNYTEKPIFPGLFTSGFIEIPKGQFNEVAKKLLEMRNWLLQYSSENNLIKKERLDSSFIYQFDINLVLIIDKLLAKDFEH